MVQKQVDNSCDHLCFRPTTQLSKTEEVVMQSVWIYQQVYQDFSY